MRAVGLAVALMLCGAAVCEASPNVPAPEPVPVRRAKKADADVTACEVDICGSKLGCRAERRAENRLAAPRRRAGGAKEAFAR